MVNILRSKKGSKINTISKGFWLEYKKHMARNFKYKSLNIIEDAKEYTAKELSILKITYSDAISQIIGSLLSTLIYKAAKEPNNYLNNRYSYLKEIANIIKKENAYWDLFQFTKKHHEMVIDGIGIEFQVLQELHEIVTMITPFNQNLVGLDGKKPIFLPSKFPYTRNYIGMMNNMPPEKHWHKKHKKIMCQNHCRSNIKSFYCRTYGFYNTNNLDMLPGNCINLDKFNKYILPRKLLDDEQLVNIIETKKRYILNKNGVVIDCYNAGDIETIFFMEADDYLLYKVIFKDNGWILNNKGDLVDDINGGEYTGFIDLRSFKREYLSVYSYLIIISDNVDQCFRILNFLLECYADLVCGTDYHPSLGRKIDSFNQILFNPETTDEEIEKYFSSNKTIGVRYTPRSLYNKGQRKNSRTSQQTREKYFVTGHLRRLTDAASASYEAKQNAREYGIEIPEGFTFVSPYYAGIEKLRTYYKKVVE